MGKNVVKRLRLASQKFLLGEILECIAHIFTFQQSSIPKPLVLSTEREVSAY